MSNTLVVPSVEDLLASSAATPEFRQELIAFTTALRAGGRVQFGTGNPPVKVVRAICGLLEAQPTLAIDRVHVDAASGCSDYRGTVTVNGTIKFQFVWDCRWRAEQEGFKDYFGDPDQIRAARTFGYRCFEVFKPIQ